MLPLAAAVDWTMVITALIVAAPGIVAAYYAARGHTRIAKVETQIKTPSGQTIGEVAEYAHDTVIANNLLLSNKNGPTKRAEPGAMAEAGKTPPRVPDEPPSTPAPDGA